MTTDRLLRRLAPRNDGGGITNSPPHRQLDPFIGMPDGALENRVLKFKLKAARRADAAFGGKRAAEHGAAIREPSTSETAVNEFLHRQHAVERAFLVQLALASNPCVGAQDHLIPVTYDVLEFPQHRRDRLVAHLFRHRDAVGLDLPIGMVGASTDKNAALPAAQHEFDLPAGVSTADSG